MANNFDLSALALASVCPGNEILYDDKGMPSVMVRIPKQTYAQLGLSESKATHPAFIVNGKEVDAIWISKYQNIVQNGRAYSLPAQDPHTIVNHDQARQYCEAKGPGWHLMTREEWAMIAHWCKANGTMPKGNNQWGRDASETTFKAIPTTRETYEGDPTRKQHIGEPAHVATGTGPLTWSHDGTAAGIWDLNGNVWEWVGGMRFVFGELQVLANNNGADSTHSQAAAGNEWRAIDGTTGELIVPDGKGTTKNSLKVDYITNHWEWITGEISDKQDISRGCAFTAVTAHESVGEKAKGILQELGLLKKDDDNDYGGDYMWGNNGNAERFPLCGGHWCDGAAAGVFNFTFFGARSYANEDFGFRSAFVELPTE